MALSRFIVIILILFNFVYSKDNTKAITLQLSWFDQFQFAGYYIAKEKGFYEDAGLNVNIKPFEFGIDIPTEVSDGKIDYAIGRETLILDKANGNDIVALYALFQASPLILISTKESGINTIADFDNKTIMTTIDDASEVSIKSMISSQKLDLKNLNFINHTHNINDLVDKKTDVISAYSSKSPYILDKLGIEYNIFSPKDYGFDMYSDLLFTSSNKIKNHLDEVLKFKQASLKGWEYAYSHIEETVKLILHKYNAQNLSKEELIYEANELKKLSYFGENKLGNINLNKLQRIYDLYNVMGLIKSPIHIEDFIFKDHFNTDLNFTAEELNFIQSNSIQCVTNASWTPFNMIDESGNLSGIAIDYWKLIIEKTGLNAKCTLIENWPDVLSAIKNDRADITLSTTKTKEREEYSVFTKPYISYPIAIATRNEHAYISDLSILKDMKVAVGKNTSAHKLLMQNIPDIKFVEVANIEEALNLLSSGKVDAAAEILPVLAYMMNKYKYSNLKISGATSFNFEVMMMVNDDKKILASIINKAINIITPEEKQAINNKWISVKYEQSFNYTLLIQIVAGFSILLVFLLFRHFQVLKHKKELDSKNRELQKSKKELNNSNKRLTMAAKVSFDLLYEKDIKSDQLFWYGDIDKFLGYKTGQISKDFESWLNIIHPDDKQKVLNTIKLYQTSIKPIFYEYRIYQEDGEFQYWQDRAMPILGKNGLPKKWIGVCTNITQAKKLTKQLIEKNKMASMGEMIGNIAHQWRQPLSVISSGATGLKLQKDFNQLTDEFFDTTCESINENAQYLSKTIDDFRNFINQNTEETTIDVTQMINEFLNLMQASTKANNINIDINIEENLTMFGYKNELIQCFINLFNNSKDALKDNCSEHERYIFIKANKSIDNKIIFTFIDNGGGIAEDIIERIFEPYFTTKHQSKGTGLGLNMTYNMINESMNGSIVVENSYSQINDKQYIGAKFTIILPM